MPRHPPPLSRVPSESVPLLHRSNADAPRSRSRRSPPWLGADSIHRSDSFARLRRRIATPPQVQALVIRCPNRSVVDEEAGLSQVPGEPFTRAPRADVPVEPDPSGHCDGPVLPAPCFTATAPTLCAFRGCLPRPTLLAVYASSRRGSLADMQDSLPAAGQTLPVEGLSPSKGPFERFRPCPGSGHCFPPLPSFLGAQSLRSNVAPPSRLSPCAPGLRRSP